MYFDDSITAQFFFKDPWNLCYYQFLNVYTYETPTTVFITYFQSSVKFVHVNQVLLYEYFYKKNGGCVNLISIFSTFHVYNFTCNLPKVANLYFLQTSDKCLKICKESISHYNPVQNKNCLKTF